MAKWSKVRKGDFVELRGRGYEVLKIKTKGKSAKVTVRGAGSVFESKVALDDKVTVVPNPLHGKDGAQRRWAHEREAKHLREPALKPGNPKVTKPPGKLSDDPWDSRRDKVERRLDEILGARLTGESTDEDAGYYVPPVDVSTIAAHLALFHGTDVSEYGVDDMLELHSNEHAAALSGNPLKVNHWHTETRPAVGK
jgi:hypothetical protein